MDEEKMEARPAGEAQESGGETRAETGKEKEPESLESLVYCWAQALTAAVVGVVLLFTFAFRLIGVNGPSMQDTLYTGDRLLVLNAMFCDFKPGDVVVINDYNAELSDTLVKRIIAVGGQTVDIDSATGTVYVDGAALDEPYIKGLTQSYDGTEFPLTLAEDEVFVMGDHRDHSTDSRSSRLGPVKEGYLQGKALLLLSPGKNPETGKSDWGRVGPVG